MFSLNKNYILSNLSNKKNELINYDTLISYSAS